MEKPYQYGNMGENNGNSQKELVKILSVEIIDTHIYLNKFKEAKCQWRNCIDDSLTW